MSSKFFAAPGHKKRKRVPASDKPQKRFATSTSTNKAPSRATKPPPTAVPKKRADRDDDDSTSGNASDSEGDEGVKRGDVSEPFSGSDSDNGAETAAEKRLRLAERYLENIRDEVDQVGFDAEDVDRDIIADRLKEDVAESKGKVYRRLADELVWEQANHSRFPGHSDITTGIATCPPYAYTVTKGRCLIKWKIQDLPKDQWPQTTKKRPKRQAPPKRKPEQVAFVRGDRRQATNKDYKGHTDNILCVAASQDGKFVVTGGADKRLIVHDAHTLEPIKVFTHHRDAVLSLAFRRGTNQLFSASKDRCVKVWALDDLAYVETLFGHADEVMDVDALSQEKCVSVGARDRTARLWKVIEESQLVFRGGSLDKKNLPNVDHRSIAHEGSIDRVAMLDDELFVTGSDNGSLSLWSVTKKKPLFVLPQAHGLDPPMRPEEASAESEPGPDVVPAPQPRWITALKTIPYSDLILSGSWCGYVRVWRLSEDKKKIERVGVLGAEYKLDSGSGVSAEEPLSRATAVKGTSIQSSTAWAIRGVINDLSVFERGKDGICVVVAVGREHRLSRWIQHGKNGAVVIEVARLCTMSTGGLEDGAEG